MYESTRMIYKRKTPASNYTLVVATDGKWTPLDQGNKERGKTLAKAKQQPHPNLSNFN